MSSPPGAAGPGAGYPQWSYNTTSHVIQEVSNSFNKALAIAATFPNKLVFFTSDSAAKAYASSSGTGGVDLSGGVLNKAVNAVGAAGAAVTGTSGANPATCAWQLSIPVAGSFCVLTKTEVRAMIAGLIIGVSGVVTIVGLMLIVVEGFQKSGAGSAAGGALEATGAALAFVPGLEGAGLAVGATGAAAKRAGSSSAASGSLDRRRSARTARKAPAGPGTAGSSETEGSSETGTA